MDYKLIKNEEGRVEFLLKTGDDFVKNDMSLASAEHIINVGVLKKPTHKDYPINIDDTWHFKGEKVKKPKKK